MQKSLLFIFIFNLAFWHNNFAAHSYTDVDSLSSDIDSLSSFTSSMITTLEGYDVNVSSDLTAATTITTDLADFASNGATFTDIDLNNLPASLEGTVLDSTSSFGSEIATLVGDYSDVDTLVNDSDLNDNNHLIDGLVSTLGDSLNLISSWQSDIAVAQTYLISILPITDVPDIDIAIDNVDIITDLPDIASEDVLQIESDIQEVASIDDAINVEGDFMDVDSSLALNSESGDLVVNDLEDDGIVMDYEINPDSNSISADNFKTEKFSMNNVESGNFDSSPVQLRSVNMQIGGVKNQFRSYVENRLKAW